MRRTGFTPMFTGQDIEDYIKAFAEQAEEKIYITLQAAGEMFVKYARESGLYNDITGNLRSSIGYVIAKDGEILTQSSFDKVRGRGENSQMVDFTTKDGKKVKYWAKGKSGDGDEGAMTGAKLAQELVSSHNTGLVLIGVAGMEYAIYVEAIESKDVIAGASIKTAEWLREAVRTVIEDSKL